MAARARLCLVPARFSVLHRKWPTASLPTKRARAEPPSARLRSVSFFPIFSFPRAFSLFFSLPSPLGMSLVSCSFAQVVVMKCMLNDEFGWGYNAATDTYENLMDAGIMDPAKVSSAFGQKWDMQ